MEQNELYVKIGQMKSDELRKGNQPKNIYLGHETFSRLMRDTEPYLIDYNHDQHRYSVIDLLIYRVDEKEHLVLA